LRRQTRARELPLLGRVAAGEPIEAIEVPDTIAIPDELAAGPAGFVLQVQGDSMVDEGIFDGDFIVLDGRRAASNGDTVVAVIDGAATVKKFYRERGRIRLQPANARLQPIFVRGANLEIRGVVVGLMRRYPRR
jgi:repressor LexA